MREQRTQICVPLGVVKKDHMILVKDEEMKGRWMYYFNNLFIGSYTQHFNDN